MVNHNKAFINALWKDSAVVCRFDAEEHDWVEDFSIEQCHVSFTTQRETSQTDANAVVQQRIILFCPVELEIKPGSKILVKLRNGKTQDYFSSGYPASYDWHQEITLTTEGDA